jgi:hypothetical protein
LRQTKRQLKSDKDSDGREEKRKGISESFMKSFCEAGVGGWLTRIMLELDGRL